MTRHPLFIVDDLPGDRRKAHEPRDPTHPPAEDLDELNQKFDRAKHAIGSYFNDQMGRSQSLAVSYAMAAAFYAAAAVFLIAALLVAAMAGFRWIELRYGFFEAFVALSAFFVVATILCAVVGIYRLKRSPKRIVPVVSRLRAALAALPSTHDVGPEATIAQPPLRSGSRREPLMPTLVIASSLLGWALLRRRNSQR